MNVAIQLETTQDSNAFIVKGRGEFQMEILIETMTREGFELNVGSPKIIYKQENGKLMEPIERVFIDCAENCIGIVTEKLSDQQGKAVNYALYNLAPRGTMFISPGALVYEGMIIGENTRDEDLNINPCKEKNLTNMRSSTSDFIRVLTPAKKMTLGQSISFIKDDEMVEITPLSVRMRKTVLSADARKRLRSDRFKEN